MRSLAVGGVFALLAACGSNVPAHANCLQDGDCPSGEACHLPEGFATGVCAETCINSSSCPTSEPWCVPDDDSSTLPFSFCACAIQGPDGGVAPGCGENSGYGCSDEYQVCLSR